MGNPSTIRCTARIDTSMPFELFTVIVNGEQQNIYRQVHRGLAIVITSIDAGNSTVVFRVMNAEVIYELERDDGDFGSGKVWLDECKISSVNDDDDDDDDDNDDDYDYDYDDDDDDD